jgi:nucleoid DNA-binding protein
VRTADASTPAYVASGFPPVVIETMRSERLEIVEKPCPARCFVAPCPDYGGRRGLKTGLFAANQYKSASDIVVQNVEKPVFLGSFRHIVPLPESNGANMATQMSKSQLIEKIATSTEVSKKEVKGVMDALVDVGHKELKKNGVFLVPGFAKFVVVKKPATKARKGTNPFTGEEMMFKAKPARKIVRARPVKAAKDAV